MRNLSLESYSFYYNHYFTRFGSFFGGNTCANLSIHKILYTLTYHYDLKDGRIVDIPGWEERNQVIRTIMRAGSMEKWKEQVGYHRRSLVENAFYRIKAIFGDRMTMRTEKNRHTEQLIRAKILNLFTSYGLPKYI